jgi:hypothetical protein
MVVLGTTAMMLALGSGPGWQSHAHVYVLRQLAQQAQKARFARSRPRAGSDQFVEIKANR